jgi:3-dehydroquinate dehydratase-2
MSVREGSGSASGTGSGAGSGRQLRFLVLHGPNLNLLGEREPDVYGPMTLGDIDRLLGRFAAERGIEPTFRQTNIEGELIDLIQDARTWADGIVVNAGGYSHTSVAIRDALAAVAVPAVAVHLSNTAARESFRHVDLVAGACRGVVAGFGWRSYAHAIELLAELLREEA